VRRRRGALEFGNKEVETLLTGPASLEIERLSSLDTVLAGCQECYIYAARANPYRDRPGETDRAPIRKKSSYKLCKKLLRLRSQDDARSDMHDFVC